MDPCAGVRIGNGRTRRRYLFEVLGDCGRGRKPRENMLNFGKRPTSAKKGDDTEQCGPR